MRQLTTLPSAETARTLADYLLTLKIDTTLEKQPDGWAIWVRDEDHLPRARQEMEEFTRNPSDPRYQSVTQAAKNLRQQKKKADEEYHRRQDRFYRRMSGNAGRITVGLIIASSLIMLLAAGRGDSPIVQDLSIAPYRYLRVNVHFANGFPSDEGEPVWVLESPGLEPILHGQVWRLVTPMLVHVEIWHLVFNMYWLYLLGGAVERRRGPIRYVAIILVCSIACNLVQYFFGHPVRHGDELVWEHLPNFGGMSGVIYGLFGYIWMKARFQPELGLGISPNTVVFMMVWFFLCMTPWIRFLISQGVANGGHAGGLLAGIVIGYAPVLWQSFRSD